MSTTNVQLSFNLPTLKSKRVHLRPVNPDDYKTLFLWHSDPTNLHMWWADRHIQSFEEFANDFQRKLKSLIQTIFVIEVKEGESGNRAGMVYTYNAAWTDRYTYLCVYLSPEYTARRIGPEAGYLAAEYAFAYFGFRKLYAEIFAYNQPSLKAALTNGFKEEGCLKAHRWFGDRYWDLHILSLTAEDFKHISPPVRD